VLGTDEAALEAATALAGATVYIWHCDTLGRYSAVSDSGMQAENTAGQKWLRAYQDSDSSGQVVFRTIVPGWYTPRIMHFHLRVHLPTVASATTYVLTTQLFFPAAVVGAVSTTAPYTSNTQSLTTPNSADQVWQEVVASGGDPTVMQMAVTGSVAAGYAATVNLGILASVSGWHHPYHSLLCAIRRRKPLG
jgi:protocatechuate 3,4-dioxygenase beta subunit